MVRSADSSAGSGRARSALEVLAPALAISAWVWLEPWGRPRGSDALFGAIIAALVLLVAWNDGLPSAAEAGLDPRGHHGRATALALAATLPLLALVVAWGGITGRLYVDPALPRALALYPLGALAQEAAIFVFVLPRAEAVLGPGPGVLATALLFAAVHLPNPLLTAGSALLVLALAWVWRRERSLVALAVAHGLLGAVTDKAIHVSMRIGASYFR